LSHYQYVLDIAEARCYILNTVWAWEFNHNKDSRHVSPITDSQTLQTQIRTDTSGDETKERCTTSGVPDFVMISCKCCARSCCELFCL